MLGGYGTLLSAQFICKSQSVQRIKSISLKTKSRLKELGWGGCTAAMSLQWPDGPLSYHVTTRPGACNKLAPWWELPLLCLHWTASMYKPDTWSLQDSRSSWPWATIQEAFFQGAACENHTAHPSGRVRVVDYRVASSHGWGWNHRNLRMRTQVYRADPCVWSLWVHTEFQTTDN